MLRTSNYCGRKRQNGNCDVYSLVYVCYFFNEAANYYSESSVVLKCVWRVKGTMFYAFPVFFSV
jgi:hypothetical protein